MKKILLLLLLVIGLFAGCSQTQSPVGSAYFTISDPGNALEGVTSIKLAVSGISIHESGADTWIQVLSEERTFDLIELKLQEVKSLVAEANLTPGSYNQVRLDVSKVMVTLNGVEKEAKLPSNVLKINVDLNVVDGEAVVLNFDFLANESLHTTTEGGLIMAPVLRLEEFSGATVEKQGKNIEVTASRSRKENKVGMDEAGVVGAGKGIPPEAELETDEAGNIVKKPETSAPKATGNAIFTIKDKANETNSSKEPNNRSVKTESGYNVTELEVTISNLSIHKAGEDEAEEASWITISSTPKTFSLLELQNVEAVLGESELEVGQYTQIRLYVTEAKGVINGEAVNLTVPGNALKLVGVLRVDENKTSLATIDFLVDKSIVKAGGKYALKPVIKLTTAAGVEVKERKTNNRGSDEIEYEAEEIVEEEEIDTEEE